MSQSHELSNFIWRIAVLLRSPFRPPQYERVMLPLVVLRRFDCVLKPTQLAVLEKFAKVGEKHHGEALDRSRWLTSTRLERFTPDETYFTGLPQLKLATSVGSSQAPTAAVDNSAPLATAQSPLKNRDQLFKQPRPLLFVGKLLS